MAIIGTNDFDVNLVDLTSVRLEGVTPLGAGVKDMATAVDGASVDGCFACFMLIVAYGIISLNFTMKGY